MPAPSPLRWWQTGVVYHVYLRSFADDDGDGTGDLPGLTARLDYLADLGVDAVWVSPFYPSPMRDFGYDVADLCGVDPRFGTLGDFDRLVAGAHARGLRVVVDWIPNHTSSDHPWFVESRAGRTSATRDWYVWRDPAPDGGPPNNWRSAFGGPAWTFDAASGQHYLHLCLPEMPDLDWHTPTVEAALFDAARFWLDRGVDGFRVDVAHWIGKDPALRDNPPADAPAFANLAKPPADFDRQAHVHDVDGPLAHAVYRRFRALLDAYPGDRAAFGEVHLTGARWAAYFGTAAAPELPVPYHFGLLSVPFEAAAVRDVVDRLEALVPPHGWPSYVLGNHDEPRLASRVGPHRTRLAALLLLTLRGTPTLYYGDELGLESLVLPPGEPPRDPLGRRVPGHGRDAGRAPMPWTAAAPHAGFCPPDAAPWLPLSADAPAKAVDVQAADPASLLHLYRRLLRLRRARPALHAGRYAPLDGMPPDVFAFARAHGTDRVAVALNFGPDAADVPLGGPVLLATHAGVASGIAASGGRLRLPPSAGAVLDRSAGR